MSDHKTSGNYSEFDKKIKTKLLLGECKDCKIYRNMSGPSIHRNECWKCTEDKHDTDTTIRV